MSHVSGMLDGYGLPFIIVRDGEGRAIANSASVNLSEGRVDNGDWGFNDYDISLAPTAFEYEYIDDDAHQCKITFETQDEKLGDHPALQEAENITVTWGYINGDIVTKQLIISGSTFRYLNDRMMLEIKCESRTNEKTKKFKTAQQDAKKKADNILEFIKWLNIRMGGADVEVRFEPDAAFSVPINGLKDAVDALIDQQTLEANIRGFGVRKVGDESNKTYSEIWSIPVKQNGQSNKHVVEETLSKVGNGPWVTEEEDDKFIIHNRDKSFSQDPIRSYVYRGSKGDLLNFMPTISDKSEYIENVIATAVDEKKKQESASSTNTSNPNTSSPSSNAQSPKEIQDEEKKRLFDDLLAEFEANGKFSKFFLGFTWIELGYNLDSTTATPGSTVATIDSLGNLLKFKQTTTIESTSVERSNRKFIKSRSEFYSYLGKIAELEQQAVNKIRENEQLATTARIRLIGDPVLRSRKIVYISGVSNKYAGKHYIMKAKHTISSNGYYVDLETIAQGREEARVVASFTKLLEKLTNPKTGEVEVNAKYTFERGVRDDFLITVLRKRREGKSLKQIIVEAYNTFYGSYDISGANKVVLEQLKDLILLELKKNGGVINSQAAFEFAVNEIIFDIDGVVDPNNAGVVVYEGPKGSNPAIDLFGNQEIKRLLEGIKIQKLP